jgi:hypothetical protein
LSPKIMPYGLISSWEGTVHILGFSCFVNFPGLTLH